MFDMEYENGIIAEKKSWRKLKNEWIECIGAWG